MEYMYYTEANNL